MIDILINQGGKNLTEINTYWWRAKIQQSDILVLVLIGKGQLNCSSAGKQIT